MWPPVAVVAASSSGSPTGKLSVHQHFLVEGLGDVSLSGDGLQFHYCIALSKGSPWIGPGRIGVSGSQQHPKRTL
jgi:hypothetical protein